MKVVDLKFCELQREMNKVITSQACILTPKQICKMEILFKGTFPKGFSLWKRISWSAFSIGMYTNFIVLIQVTELQRGMAIQIYLCIQHRVDI